MRKERTIVRSIVLAAALAMGLAMASSAQAEMLVYEGFNYLTGTPSGNGVLLAGQGGAELGLTGTWSAWTSNVALPINVYQEGTLSGVMLSAAGNPPSGLNVFDGTVDNLTTSGGYAGSFGNVTTAGGTDHAQIWRPLAPSVTATFVDGATTWFSFVSARAYNPNAKSPSFAIGAAPLGEDRGTTAFGEAIGAGGSIKTGNTTVIFPEFWDKTLGTPGEDEDPAWYPLNNGTFGIRTSAGDGSVAVPAADYLTWVTANPDGTMSPPNIIIGKILWSDTGPDVISVVRFRQTEIMTEATFDAAIAAQPNLCSANWTTQQPVLDQSKFDTISIGGGKWFADEIRIATTFDEVIAVPEPATLALLAFGGIGLLTRRRRVA